MYFTYEADSVFSTRTTLAYLPPIHTDYTPSPVHSFNSYPSVTTPRTFTDGTSDPPSPSHDSSAETVTPKGNPTPRKNPPNPVTNVPADPDSYPGSSYSSWSNSFDSSEDDYSKQVKCMKNNKNKC